MPPLFSDPEPETLDDARRRALGGEFVKLSAGYTHYQIGGPEEGLPVVLVHGTSVPFFVWDALFEVLTQAGFRVLRYDLFGRGYSDRPDARYDLELFVRQLEELIDRVGMKQPLDLVGFSLGGVIASEFVLRHASTVRKLALIGPAGI